MIDNPKGPGCLTLLNHGWCWHPVWSSLRQDTLARVGPPQSLLGGGNGWQRWKHHALALASSCTIKRSMGWGIHSHYYLPNAQHSFAPPPMCVLGATIRSFWGKRSSGNVAVWPRTFIYSARPYKHVMGPSGAQYLPHLIMAIGFTWFQLQLSRLHSRKSSWLWCWQLWLQCQSNPFPLWPHFPSKGVVQPLLSTDSAWLMWVRHQMTSWWVGISWCLSVGYNDYVTLPSAPR